MSTLEPILGGLEQGVEPGLRDRGAAKAVDREAPEHAPPDASTTSDGRRQPVAPQARKSRAAVALAQGQRRGRVPTSLQACEPSRDVRRAGRQGVARRGPPARPTVARAVLRALIAAAWAMLVPPVLARASGGVPASGQLVHDPTAYVQHVRSVRAALVAEEQRALQLLGQARMHALQLREHEASLRQLAGARAETLAPARQAVRDRVEQATGYALALERLGGSLDRLHAEARRIQHAHAASGLTWREYALREQRLAEGRDRDRQEAFAEALEAMRRAAGDHRAVQALQARAADTAGAHESLQLLNQQLSMLVAQSAAAQAALATERARERHAQALADTLIAPERQARAREREAAAERAARASAEGARSRARSIAAIEARRLR